MAMSTVAARRDVTNGAHIMDPAKRICEYIHAVRRVGLYFCAPRRKFAMPSGGLGVNSGSAPSGD
jgi:hypothetical protein